MLDCKGAKEQSFDFGSYLGRGQWVHGTADCLFDNLTQMPIRHLGQSYNNGSLTMKSTPMGFHTQERVR